MGKKDGIMTGYYGDKARYADLVNVCVFHGRQVVFPQDVHERDSRTIGILGKLRKRVLVQKYRDIIRKLVLGMNVVLVALENQDQIHYAMPIHIIEMQNFPDVDMFQTDLREVFGFFQRSEDKNAVQQFVEERKAQFERLDEDAYDMIAALTKTQEFVDKKEEYRDGGSGINMCRAIKDLIQDGKREGKLEGAQRINELNRRLLADGRQEDMIKAVQDSGYQENLLKEYGL